MFDFTPPSGRVAEIAMDADVTAYFPDAPVLIATCLSLSRLFVPHAWAMAAAAQGADHATERPRGGDEGSSTLAD